MANIRQAIQIECCLTAEILARLINVSQNITEFIRV